MTQRNNCYLLTKFNNSLPCHVVHFGVGRRSFAYNRSVVDKGGWVMDSFSQSSNAGVQWFFHDGGQSGFCLDMSIGSFCLKTLSS